MADDESSVLPSVVSLSLWYSLLYGWAVLAGAADAFARDDNLALDAVALTGDDELAPTPSKDTRCGA